MRSPFAKPRKVAKIFGVRAKFFNFTKKFGFAKGGVLCKDTCGGHKYVFSRLRFPTSKTRQKNKKR